LGMWHLDQWITLDMLYSVQRSGRVEIIANDQGHRITPSWVSFTDEERLYVVQAIPLHT